jgi:hypothetical protein
MLVGALALGACSNSGPVSEFSSAPDGVKQANWDEYCRYSRELLRSITAHNNGTLADELFVVALGRYREGFDRIAELMPDHGSQVGKIVAALDRLQLGANHEHSHAHGDDEAHKDDPPLDDSGVRAAVDALPSCAKAP